MKLYCLMLLLTFSLNLIGCSSSPSHVEVEKSIKNTEEIKKVEKILRPFYLYGIAANDYKVKLGKWPKNEKVLSGYVSDIYPDLNQTKLTLASLNKEGDNLLEIIMKLNMKSEDKDGQDLRFSLLVEYTGISDKPILKLSFYKNAVNNIKKDSESIKQYENNASMQDVIIGLALAMVFNKYYDGAIFIPVDIANPAMPKEQMKNKLKNLFNNKHNK